MRGGTLRHWQVFPTQRASLKPADLHFERHWLRTHLLLLLLGLFGSDIMGGAGSGFTTLSVK